MRENNKHEMKRTTRGFFSKIAMGLLVLAMLLGICTPFCAYAEEEKPKIVKVGYVQLQGFLYKNSRGNYEGLAYELLEEIASYNNWTYRFVESTYEECEHQLEIGTIDFFVPYQKTPERERIFEYSNEVFCPNNASLLTAPNSEMYYDDYSSMNGIVIGVAKGTRNGDRFKKMFDEHHCNVTIKPDYKDQSELVSAMKNGEVDAFVSASSRGIKNCKVIMTLPQTMSYAIDKKGDRTYLNAIDSALKKINANTPNFISELNEKYSTPEGGMYPALTKDEVNYIAQNKKVTVMVGAQECDEKGDFTGSSQEIFGRISEMTGLTFVPVIEADTSQITTEFKQEKADILYSFNRDPDWARQHNAWMSISYADFYNQMVTRQGMSSKNVKKIAVVNNSYLEYYLRKNGQHHLVKCSSYSKGLDMVLNGKVDAIYCNTPIGNYYSTFPKYRNLSFITSYETENSYCMAISRQCDERLLDIIDKCIHCIPKSELSKAFETQASARKVSLSDAFYENPKLMIMLIMVVVVTLLTLVFMVLYIGAMHQKNTELQKVTKARSDFFARMSHDLRTPMNGILGMLHLTEDEEDISTIKNYIGKAEASGDYMLSLINDTLDLQRLEGGKVVLQPKAVNVKEIISSMMEMVKSTAEQKGVQFVLNIDPSVRTFNYVRIDPVRVSQIFTNLVSNAIKFTPVGGRVEFQIECLEHKDGKAYDRIRVIDNGVGMSEEFIKHNMFQAYAQEENQMSNKYAGSGLGLAIVKNLIEMMNATICVESKLGKGTTFTIDIAFELVDEKEVIAQTEEKQICEKQQKDSLKGKKILLCEDHPLNAEIAEKLLEKLGCDVTWVENGQKGVEAFRESVEFEYDAILMDIRMPIMNGLDATKTIRALDRNDAKSVVIIAMTANAYDSDIQASKEAGMNQHLAKPIDPKILYRTLAGELKK